MGEIVASPTEKPPFEWTLGWRVLLTLGSFLSAGPFVYFYGTLLWFTSIATETPMPLEFTVLLSLLAIFVVLVLSASRRRTGRSVFSFDFNDQTTTNVTNDRDLFPVGRSRLVRRATVTVRVDCERGQLDLNARLQFNLTDAFVDVLDLSSTIPGNQEIPSGVPFAIVHLWTEGFVRRNVRLR